MKTKLEEPIDHNNLKVSDMVTEFGKVGLHANPSLQLCSHENVAIDCITATKVQVARAI
jgi:hypothetical protein